MRCARAGSAGLCRGPGPRLCVPSRAIHALTFLRSLNSRDRSTARSLTSANLRIGSRVIGWSSLSTSAEQAIRTLPLMFIVQLPQTSSRQFESQITGVVGWPWAFTGLRWISIRHEMTFAPLRQGTRNSSKRPSEPGSG